MVDEPIVVKEGIRCIRTVDPEVGTVYCDEKYIRFVLESLGGMGDPALWEHRLARLTAAQPANDAP